MTTPGIDVLRKQLAEHRVPLDDRFNSWQRDPDAFWILAQQFVSKLNQEAMRLLQRDGAEQKQEEHGRGHAKMHPALACLTEAQGVVQELLDDPELRLYENYIMRLSSLTYNNMACFWKACLNFRQALRCSDSALRIDLAADDPAASASSHLNMCAVLSDMGRHASASLQAQAAVRNLERHERLLLQRTSEVGDKVVDGVPLSLVCFAFYNLAVEQEHLKKWRASELSFKHAAEYASLCFGPAHSTSKQMQRAYEDSARGNVKRYPQSKANARANAEVRVPRRPSRPHSARAVLRQAALEQPVQTGKRCIRVVRTSASSVAPLVPVALPSPTPETARKSRAKQGIRQEIRVSPVVNGAHEHRKQQRRRKGPSRSHVDMSGPWPKAFHPIIYDTAGSRSLEPRTVKDQWPHTPRPPRQYPMYSKRASATTTPTAAWNAPEPYVWTSSDVDEYEAYNSRSSRGDSTRGSLHSQGMSRPSTGRDSASRRRGTSSAQADREEYSDG